MVSIVAVVASLILLLIGFLYQYPGRAVKFFERIILIITTKYKVRRLKLADDIEVEFIERGSMKESKISILFVHGFAISKFNWAKIESYIPENVHIIAVDLPGHGGTTEFKHDDITVDNFVTYLKEFCVAVGLDKKRFHIAGLSMGGHISGTYALKYPDDLQSLTLICAGGFKSPIQSKLEETYYKTHRIDLIPVSIEEYRKFINLIFHSTPTVPDFIISGYVENSKNSKSYLEKVIAQYYNEEVRHSLDPCIHTVQVPTLVVWGKEDQLLHVSATDVIKDKLPTCKVVLLDDCGHAIDLEKPEELAQAMLNFIYNIKKEN